MGEINIPKHEQDAIKSIDIQVLDEIIEQCLYEERPDALHPLRLGSCGPYIAAQLRHYEKALAEYGKAKSVKKRDETRHDAIGAGHDLMHRVQLMKNRVDTEEEEGLLFYIDDHFVRPSHFSEHITVCISYRWRSTINDAWIHGSITFFHAVELRPDYIVPQITRRLSSTKKEKDRQENLSRKWDYLMKLGLYLLREYFRKVGNGNEIPEKFQVKTDPWTRDLNNFSANFWN